MPIEQVSPELERIVSPDQELEELGRGYRIAEGPVWYREGGYLLFCDWGNNRRMKWAPGEGVTLSHEPTNNATGLTRDPTGRLIACEPGARRVTRLEPDGSTTVVANSYHGGRLNRPNDVATKSDGSIYFTDPEGPDPELDLDFAGVYRVSPDLGTINLVVGDFIYPNGLAFSTDESILYVDDSHRGHIRAFDLEPNGMLNLATDRVFCELKGERPGVVDGIKLDVEGNVYCAGPGGVWIIDPNGKHLGTVLTGSWQTTNCAWGDEDWKTLYITTASRLGRIRLKIPGVPVPG